VNLALLLAESSRAKVHILGLPPSKDKLELNKFNVKIKSVEKLVVSENLEFVSTVVHGDSLAEEAMKYAKKNNCDLIAINTGHESEITGIFLGAFAQQIVNHSSIPVLSIRHLESHYDVETPGYGV
jgi:nucleotide-binding universal stress UspA family protein